MASPYSSPQQDDLSDLIPSPEGQAMFKALPLPLQERARAGAAQVRAGLKLTPQHTQIGQQAIEQASDAVDSAVAQAAPPATPQANAPALAGGVTGSPYTPGVLPSVAQVAPGTGNVNEAKASDETKTRTEALAKTFPQAANIQGALSVLHGTPEYQDALAGIQKQQARLDALPSGAPPRGLAGWDLGGLMHAVGMSSEGYINPAQRAAAATKAVDDAQQSLEKSRTSLAAMDAPYLRALAGGTEGTFMEQIAKAAASAKTANQPPPKAAGAIASNLSWERLSASSLKEANNSVAMAHLLQDVAEEAKTNPIAVAKIPLVLARSGIGPGQRLNLAEIGIAGVDPDLARRTWNAMMKAGTGTQSPDEEAFLQSHADTVSALAAAHAQAQIAAIRKHGADVGIPVQRVNDFLGTQAAGASDAGAPPVTTRGAPPAGTVWMQGQDKIVHAIPIANVDAAKKRGGVLVK